MVGPSTSADAPRGTVTLAFTDVEGSTALWDRVPSIMRRALEIHDRVMRDAIADAGGYEVKTEGDAFMVAFSSVQVAIGWCIDVQRQLLRADWPEEILAEPEAGEEMSAGTLVRRGLRVRMGIHVGEPHCVPHPMTGRMDYFGPMVNRAARIAGAGYGGQILVSDAVRRLAASSEDFAFADLGEHALKGLTSPERIWELTPRDLVGRVFPAVRTADAVRTNLTEPRSELIGREHELEALTCSVKERRRLITLLGPPGVGKTRLAREHAWGRVAELSAAGDGVWFCDLTGASSRADVTALVAGVIAPSLSLRSGDDAAQLGRVLGQRGAALLVLDNAESAVSPLAEILPTWLASARGLEVLVTSRHRLGIRDEVCIEVEPLRPDAAVELFSSMARAAAANYHANARRHEVEDLVMRLDCLPLAIEVAAARARVLGPAQQRERLERRGLSQLRGLERALLGSWQLLDERVQRALTRCAVFRGSFDLEAAEAVLDEEDLDALELLQDLRDRSLVSTRDAGDFGLRFFLLESVREFAAARLAERTDRDEALARWATHYAGLGDDLATACSTSDAPRALARLRLERSNLMAVGAAETITPDLRLRVVRAVDRQLATQGPVSLRWQNLAIAEPVRDAAPALRLELLISLLELHRSFEGDQAAADRVIERAGELAAEVADQGILSRLHTEIGALLRKRGEADEASRQLSRALELARTARDALAECLALDAIAVLAFERCRMTEAVTSIRHAVAVAAQLGDMRTEVRLRNNLGAILQDSGEPSSAAVAYRQGLELAQALGDDRLREVITSNLGVVLNDQCRLDEARNLLQHALVNLREAGDTRMEGNTTMYLGINSLLRRDLVSARGDLEAALRLERAASVRRFEALCQGYLGIEALASGRPGRAEGELATAVESLGSLGDGGMQAYFEALRALALVRTGRSEKGREVADRAQALGRERSDLPWLVPCIDRILAAAFALRAPPPDPREKDNQHCRLAALVIDG